MRVPDRLDKPRLRVRKRQGSTYQGSQPVSMQEMARGSSSSGKRAVSPHRDETKSRALAKGVINGLQRALALPCPSATWPAERAPGSTDCRGHEAARNTDQQNSVGSLPLCCFLSFAGLRSIADEVYPEIPYSRAWPRRPATRDRLHKLERRFACDGFGEHVKRCNTAS